MPGCEHLFCSCSPNTIRVLASLRKKHKRTALKMLPRRLNGSPRLLYVFFVASVQLFVIRSTTDSLRITQIPPETYLYDRFSFQRVCSSFPFFGSMRLVTGFKSQCTIPLGRQIAIMNGSPDSASPCEKETQCTRRAFLAGAGSINSDRWA